MSPDRQTLDALKIDRSRERRRWPWGGVLFLLLVLAGVAVAAAWWIYQPDSATVRTIQVRQTSATSADRTLLNASGYVTARRAATVSSKVTGKGVEVLIEEGKEVVEGDVLARIDASNIEKNLHLAQAQLESARRGLDETRANLQQAERELKRVSQLAASRAASQAELDRAETEVVSTKARLARQVADVAVSESELAIWQQQLDDNVIRAPFSGVVTSKDAQPGEMVSPISAGGGFIRTGICTLVDMQSLEIEVDVSESYINRVTPGQPVEATLDAYPQWRIAGHVIAIVPTADRQKATVKVRVGFDQLDPRILPEMSVKVAFQNATEPVTAQSVLVVPQLAVQQHDARDIVWVVRDDQVERRAVKIAQQIDDQVTIAAGVTAGERVVVEGAAGLVDGARVREIQE